MPGAFRCNHSPSVAAAVAAFLLLSACDDSPSEPLDPFGGRVSFEDGDLVVRGGEASAQVLVTRTATGARVQIDGEEASFTGAVRSVRVDGGAEDDVIRYEQKVVADLELTVLSGAGDDEILLVFEPEGSGEAIAVDVAVDAGAGDDRVDFRWRGQGVSALDASTALTVNGTATSPEVGDEVLVSFEGGAADRPATAGGTYSPRGSGATGSPWALEFEASVEGANNNAPPGSQVAPSQTKVIVLGLQGGDVDFLLHEGARGASANEPGEVRVTGSGILRGDFSFERDPTPAAAEAENGDERWVVRVSDVTTAGEAAVSARAASDVASLALVSDEVALERGAHLEVTVEGTDGPDALLAHLFDLSGEGTFHFVADGGEGDDLAAALLRDAAPAGDAAFSIVITGGDGDDMLGLGVPGEAERDGPIHLGADGGSGSDTCFLADQVAAVRCDVRDGVDDALRELLDQSHGAEFADDWPIAGLSR